MTWTTIALIWFASGLLSAIWHIVDEWWHHEVFESTTSDKIIESVILTVICLVAGPIGIAVKIWEKWFDPSNV